MANLRDTWNLAQGSNDPSTRSQFEGNRNQEDFKKQAAILLMNILQQAGFPLSGGKQGPSGYGPNTPVGGGAGYPSEIEALLNDQEILDLAHQALQSRAYQNKGWGNSGQSNQDSVRLAAAVNRRQGSSARDFQELLNLLGLTNDGWKK